MADAELRDLAGTATSLADTDWLATQDNGSGDLEKITVTNAQTSLVDTAAVTAAGALMDSEVDADIKTLVLPASTTISAFGATVIDDADASTARTTLGVAIGSDVQAHDAVLDATTASFTTADETKLDAIEALADVTDATNVAAAGAPIITSGAGAPSSTPASVGDIYVDTSNDNVWAAAGTASSADWKQATGAGGGDLLAANNLSDVANAGTSRTNLGLAIGSDVQAYAAALDSVSGTNTGDEAAASATVSGVVELATIAEVDTGTDTVRAITPAGLAGSALQTKVDGVEALADVTDATNVTAAGAHMSGGTDVPVADGGTGASTAAAARTNLSAAEDYVTPAIVTGTTDTLAAADHAVTNRYNNAAQVTVTIPTDAADDLPDGFWCSLFAEGAGGLTLSTTGVTLAGSSPNTTISQNEALVVQKTATANTWLVIGGTAA